MSDINPVLDRLAHDDSGGSHLFHHHDRAAHHHEKAAEHHRRAAEAHRTGDTTGAAGYATQAWGHGAHAQHHANESLKGYAPTEREMVVGSTPAETGQSVRSSSSGGGSTTAEEGTLGYATEGVATGATVVNPDAAYTPNIGGAPGQRS